MLNLDPAKLLVIGMIALVVLGPERLPKVARQIGGAWRELTKLRDQVTDEVKTAFPVEDLPHIPRISGASSAISSAVSSFTRPLHEATSANRAERDVDAVDSDDSEMPRAISNRAATRRAPDVVVHPALGDFAFLPDDPSMN